ncbi:uncharacterized protein EI97DRAFT_362015, partial [Westerdykella ornata]
TTVLNPALITTDFDLLRFEAAAFDQLRDSGLDHVNHTNDDLETNGISPFSTLLISSPYNNPGHYLPLETLDLPSTLFAKALTALKPARADYATASYTSALNFPVILNLLRELSLDEGFQWDSECSFYVVVFRSRLKKDVDIEELYRLDYESHREACESGGLLKYWFGKVDAERRNLATCFWRSREDARKGGLGPWHAKARNAARTMYESITFATHRFTILRGATDLRLEDWTD